MTELLLYNAVNQGIFSKAEDNPVNLGLFSISAYAKKNGYNVKLIKNIRFLDIENDLRPFLKDTLLVGISCMTGDPIKNGIEFSRVVKKIAPDLPIVWGGYHATLEPGQTISNENIDFLIRGWGEEPIVELLEALKKQKDFRGIKGLSYKIDGQIIHNPVRKFSDINLFPRYDYDLQEGFKAKIKGQEFIYCSSRGCPFSCTFCSVAAFYEGNKPYYSYSLDRVFNDIEYFQNRYNPSSFLFFDDNFFVDKNRIIDFCLVYKERGCNFKWDSFGRCDFFSNCDEKLLALLSNVNLKKIYFGAESGSPAILKRINKNITPEQIVNSLVRVKNHGIGADYTFMSGFPFETIDDLEITLGIMKQLQKIDTSAGIRIFNFTPSPKIELLKDCLEKGFQYPAKLEDWAEYEYHCFIPKWSSAKHARLLKILPWITSFLAKDTTPSKKDKFMVNLALKFLSLSARVRFNNNFYFFPLEWLALGHFYKKHLGI